MATPHIQAEVGEIAKTIIMPGDPLRAKYIADNYLENAKLINQVRNILGYTGTYKGKEVTVMASGMGMPSIGIYSYELFNFFNVETIIRVGSCGAYTDQLKVRDIILVESAYSESSYANMMSGNDSKILYPTIFLNQKIKEKAKQVNIKIEEARIHCSDVFYGNNINIKELYEIYNCVAVEMESFALFQNANLLNKNAACILTVSDSLVTGETTTSEERQNSFNEMIVLALESIL